MSEQPDHRDPRLLFLEELVEQHARVAGDIYAIDSRTFAIHGTILVDGEVIMAEFDRIEAARAALEQLRRGDPDS
jgi:hypothetical protein